LEVRLLSGMDDWTQELKQATGREFALPVDAECRIDDGIGGWSDIRVKLSAGTRVQLLETTYDSSLTRVYHRLKVFTGASSGETVILMDVPGSFPWDGPFDRR